MNLTQGVANPATIVIKVLPVTPTNWGMNGGVMRKSGRKRSWNAPRDRPKSYGDRPEVRRK